MRNLSANALTKIAEHYGNEPIVILEIAWVTGTRKHYADRTVSGIEGKILDISNLDNVIKVSKNDDSQEITAVLDDTNGTIKNIMDTHDIHKRDVWVYQYFEGLDIADRFLLFRGKINSPIIWNEGDQTITISIVSQLEDKEVGFSPEEGQFPHIPKELIGKTWPSIFGTPLDVPAVQIGKAVTGTTLCPVGIISGQQEHLGLTMTFGGRIISVDSGITKPDLREAKLRKGYVAKVADRHLNASVNLGRSKKASVLIESERYLNLYWDYRKQEKEIADQIADTMARYHHEIECARLRRQQTVNNATGEGNDDNCGGAAVSGLGCNPVRILGGEDFPRGTITLNIDDGLFTGYFEGDSDIFVIESRYHLEHSAAVTRDVCTNPMQFGPTANSRSVSTECEPYPEKDKRIIWETGVYPGYGNVPPLDDIYRVEHILEPRDESLTGGGSRPDSGTRDNLKQIMRHFWADAGASVVIEGDEPITYIVSIVPGTVLQVKAFKTFNGIARLINVPSNMWTTEVKQYGSITAVQVTIIKSLSTLEDQNWGDDIYVTFESDIGPNIVDIITYLIQTYTDLQIDTTSFNSVKTKLTPFPANFALLDRKNIIDVLSEMAFQARCNLRLVNGKFYLTYLAEEPSTVDTITLNDIENQSVEVFLTSTEDIVTKYTALWRLSYAQSDLNKIILRHNVKKYGIQEEEYKYYIYNQPDIIHKIATFWLIRKANTWKRIRFKTFLNKLNLETFDAILLQFGSKKYVADADIKAIIEQANIDGENYNIIIECWLPVKSGEMSPYEFAWPANVSAQWIFPTDREVELGLDGGDGIGRNATGILPVGDVSGIGDQTIYVGGTNVIFGSQTDRGDKYPSDQGFTAQTLRIDTTLATISVELKPELDLSLDYAEPIEPPELPPDLYSPISIILETTPIVSKNLSNNVGTLSDILGLNSEDDILVFRTDAKFRGDDGGCQTAQFHFKYDTLGEVWGAGTAFLREDAETAPTVPEHTDEDSCRDED